MSAERNPQADDSLLAAPVAWLTTLALRWPKSTITASLLVALVSVAYAMNTLAFHTSRLDLISPDSDYNKLWLDYIEEFGKEDDAVVVVQSETPAHVTAAIDAVAERLVSEPDRFQSVLHKVDLAPIRAKGLFYLSPEQLAELDQSLLLIDPVLQGEWGRMRLDAQLIGAAHAASSVDRMAHLDEESRAALAQQTAAHLARITASLTAAIDDRPQYVSPWPLADERLSQAIVEHPEHLLASDGRVGFVLLRLVESESGFAPRSAAIDRLRELLDETSRQHEGVKIGLTGLPVLEDDEMRVSQRDMTYAGLLSFAGVVMLFIAGLGGLRYPTLAVGVLAVAFCWTMGYMTLAVGHLNILTVSFGSILIGMGIDFGIHYVARYLQTRTGGVDSHSALVATARSIGPGVVTGAVTTAAGFLAAFFTPFTGLAELGVIAGGGIMLCLLAVLVLLPPLMLLSDAQRPPAPFAALRVDRWFAVPLRFPRTAVWLSLAATLVCGYAALNVRYDHNLLNLQARGLESVELEEMLLSETDHSVWFASALADTPEELLAKKEKFAALPTVERVEEIVSILPPDALQKQPLVARLHARLQNLPDELPLIPTASRDELLQAVSTAHATLGPLAARDDSIHHVQTQLAAAHAQIRRLGSRDMYARVAEFQQRSAGDLLAQLALLRSISMAEAPQLSDLPESLVTRFVGKHQRHLLKIYGRGELWDHAALGQFVADVKSVDPNTTGQPLQTFYASRQMQQSYLQAAFYALVAVVALLIIDFRSLGATLLVLLPLSFGLVQMFGLMAWLDIPLNPANMIVLPLIMGIGMDYGVHVVHDYRSQVGPYRLQGSIVVAILLGALTTIVGFGSLMIANHRGLESLGRVLTIGISCCLLNSFVMLPALLAWIRERQLRETPSEAPTSSVEPQVVALPLQPARRAAPPAAAEDTHAPRRRAA